MKRPGFIRGILVDSAVVLIISAITLSPLFL
jgi:hypothetical protein